MISKQKFDKLSKAQKRIEICRDVLKRIKAHKIRPSRGYLIENKPVYRFNDADSQTQAFNFVNLNTCKVCAKGALMCSWVGNFKGYSCENISQFQYELDRSLYPQELLAIFGREMLDNIEAAFEWRIGNVYWHCNPEMSRKYSKAFKKKSLSYIMKYIIANKGKFPLPKKTVDKSKKS